MRPEKGSKWRLGAGRFTVLGTLYHSIASVGVVVLQNDNTGDLSGVDLDEWPKRCVPAEPNPPAQGSRWCRKDSYDPDKGPYNGYTVIFTTNLRHRHERHPPQVVYCGDNGKVWSLPLADWPGNLKPEGEE